eukprot:gene12571-16760_t
MDAGRREERQPGIAGECAATACRRDRAGRQPCLGRNLEHRQRGRFRQLAARLRLRLYRDAARPCADPARAQRPRAHLAQRREVAVDILRRDRPALALTVLVITDAAQRIGLAVEQETARRIERHLPHAERLPPCVEAVPVGRLDLDHQLVEVQIGITVSALLVGASSGAQFADSLSVWLKASFPQFAAFADQAAFLVVIVFMTFVTLVFAELVPKRIAIARPETIALAVVDFIMIISRIAAPFVALLAVVSDGVMRLVGVADDTGADCSYLRAMVGAVSRPRWL